MRNSCSPYISLAHEQGIKVTQEEIENIDDMERLKSHGRDVLQGYLHSKPLSEADFIKFPSNDSNIH